MSKHPFISALSSFFQPNPDGTKWWARTFRITTTRVIFQLFFFALFQFFFFTTWFSRLKGYPVSLFLEIDPLIGIATAISNHTVYRFMWRGLLVLIPTLFLGRVFCGWVCPFGSLQQFWAWIFNIRSNRDNMDRNLYHPAYQIKYLILIGFLILSLFGLLQIGLLDPIAFLVRSFTMALSPLFDTTSLSIAEKLARQGWNPDLVAFLSTAPGAPEKRLFAGAWFVGLLFVGVLGMSLVIPRFFCRTLCPLGALLGIFSRFSLFSIQRDLSKCTDCQLCLRCCEGACNPQSALRRSECLVCFNCIDDCPEDALSYSVGSWPVKEYIVGDPAKGEAKLWGKKVKSRNIDTDLLAPEIPRRRLLLTVMAGVVAFPFLRMSKDVNRRGFSDKAIRPPSSLEENEFLKRCIKCQQCVRICPTNVLQPSRLVEGGLEGLWTPVMDFSVGHCQRNCTLCSEVCPTGAIQKCSLDRKLGVGAYQDKGPIRVGTAFIDRGRCLPWAMQTPCVVCQEVCPVSPKAIGTTDEPITRWDGIDVVLNRPYIRPELCIGCGICQRECPVLDDAAIYITPIGETRSTDRTLLLKRDA